MKRNIILLTVVALGLLGVWCYGAMHQQLEHFESQNHRVSPEILARALDAAHAADLRQKRPADEIEVY